MNHLSEQRHDNRLDGVMRIVHLLGLVVVAGRVLVGDSVLLDVP